MTMNRFDSRSRSLLTLLCVLALLTGVFVAAPAAAADPSPHISANLSFGGIGLSGPPGTSVPVKISNPENLEQEFSSVVDIEGSGWAEVQPEQIGFPLLPDMVITAGTQELTIPEGLTFDTFDVDSQVVAGRAPFGPVEVMLGGCGGDAAVIDGAWSFNVEARCEPEFEIQAHMPADVKIHDEDGDETLVSFQWPRFVVSFDGPPNNDDMIEGQGWPYRTPLLIHIEDASGDLILDTTTLVDGLMTYNSGEAGLYDFYRDAMSFQFYEFPPDFRFQPGWTVTVGPTDSSASPQLTKTHTITSVLPTGVNLEENTVFGIADPGSQVVVSGCAIDWSTYDPDNYDGQWPWGNDWDRVVNANDLGFWEANFSQPGYARFSDNNFRLVDETCELRGYEFGASQIDSDFDETQRTFLIPAIFAGLNQGDRIEIYRVNTDPKLVEIFDHPGGELLWSEVMYPIADEGGNSYFEIGSEIHGVDLQPGMLVRVPGGELVLAELTLEFDIDNDIVFGTAPGSETVQVDVGTDGVWCSGEVPVAGGYWEVDPGVLQGPEGADCTDFDLTKQSYASISVGDPTDVLRDFDGDRTSFVWETPPQWMAEEIAGFVDFLLGDADGKTAKSLGKTLDRLRESLDPALWVDYRTLDAKKGGGVFELDAEAARELEKIESLLFTDEEGNLLFGTDIAGALVFAVDRPLAELAIQRATASGGDTKDLAEASAFLDLANDAFEQGAPSVAIEYLGQAWRQAQKALK